MAKVVLHCMHTENFKKIIYKFVDGKITETFRGLSSAAFDAGIADSGLSNYINKKMKKPRKIPANVEYSYSNKL